MKVLQLCHKIPFPVHDGGAWSLFHNALGLINNGIDLKVLAIRTPQNQVTIGEMPAGFRKRSRFECSLVDTRVKPLDALMNLFGNQSYFVKRFWSEKWNAHLIQVLQKEQFDIIQLEHLYMCLYLETIRKYSRARVILRPQNVENQVWKRYLNGPVNLLKKQYLQIAANRLLNFEMHMAREVDGVIAISDADAGTFREYSPETPCTIVPIGFDFSKVGTCEIHKQFENFPAFYHLGSMDWMPNVQGIKWFIEEVMPFVAVDYPEFVFRIAGKKMPEWFFNRQGKNLVVDRDVTDSQIYHSDKPVMIVPILSGGGLRVKIIEAMALGKTVISTTIGAEGIPYTDQKNILIADTKEDFAIQIKKCRDSMEFCQTIGKNAQKLARENFDCNVTAAKMILFYKRLSDSHPTTNFHR